MKHIFRNLIRKEKWTLVAIEPTKDTMWSSGGEELNRQDYIKMRNWCEQTFHKEVFATSLQSVHGISPGLKRFIFNNPADATMFRLRWE